jgi:hypothetical protein
MLKNVFGLLNSVKEFLKNVENCLRVPMSCFKVSKSLWEFMRIYESLWEFMRVGCKCHLIVFEFLVVII